MNYSASTELWIGPQNFLKAQALMRVQQEYCPDGVCKRCSVCQQIEQQQFHGFMMLSTTKSTYSRSDLDLIFSKIVLARPVDEPFFCIITQADKLSDISAHSLLKLLEEPPFGWHWILLTHRHHEFLPTVLSRCVIKEFSADLQQSGYHELYTVLIEKNMVDMIHVHQLLERTKISDYESRLLLDDTIIFWTHESLHDSRYFPIVKYLHSCLEKQPMPGSSKIFWRNVYLKLFSLLQE